MYYNNDSSFFTIIIFIVIAYFLISMIRRMMSSKSSTTSTATNSATSPKPQAVPKAQMAEDIKATKTSRIADAASILDDLGSTSANYRHYCELVGNAMASSNVTAPYSRRQVAYYEIECYRIDATYGGGQEETLVAHERSFDPFFFTDSSCDTPVYVDLESFGGNKILVNSTNHIEGPNSDFSKAFQKNATTSSSSGTQGAYAMVAHAVERGANALLGAASAIRNALTPQGPSALAPQLAFVGPAGSVSAPSCERDTRGSNVYFGTVHGGGGGRSHKSRPYGPRGPQRSAPRSSQPQIHIGFGGMPSPGLNDFIGGYNGPWVMGGGSPYIHHRPHYPHGSNSDLTGVLLGMSLSTLLNSMNSAQQTAGYSSSADTFRGYRLVENIVPLGSPIYCIGEIYKNGTDIYMSRSLAKDYPTSFFATKPESEVLSVIGSK